MKTLDESICLADEVKAIAAYIGLKWSPIANLESLVQDVRVAAEHSARALFEDYPVWEVAVAAEDARETMLKQKYGDGRPNLRYYDAGCQMISNIRDGLKDVRTAALNLDAKWDRECAVNKVLQSLKPKYPDLVVARPNGWVELEANYADYDAQKEYDTRPDSALFQGSKTGGALSGDFVFRTALPYVMYDEKCQSRKAHNVLVGAIFAQFMTITEYLNTQKICRDLEAVVATLPHEHVFELTIDPQTPVLKTLIKMGAPYATRTEYEDAIAQVAAYNALSDAEKALKQAESEASMATFMAELMNPSKHESYEEYLAEQDIKTAPIKTLLMATLGESSKPGSDVIAHGEEMIPSFNGLTAADSRPRMRC